MVRQDMIKHYCTLRLYLALSQWNLESSRNGKNYRMVTKPFYKYTEPLPYALEHVGIFYNV